MEYLYFVASHLCSWQIVFTIMRSQGPQGPLPTEIYQLIFESQVTFVGHGCNLRDYKVIYLEEAAKTSHTPT